MLTLIFQCLPIIYGDEVTRKNILVYTLLLIPSSYLPWGLGYSGTIYLLIITVCGLEFLRRSFLLYKKSIGAEKGLFLYSIFYLSIVFAGICFDKLIDLKI
jgi:protoheme IX farnesyltransferase